MGGIIQQLAEKKMLVVTGKGGSGKSILSLALAHRLSALGKRVWLVEIGRKRDKAFTRLPELVGKKSLEHSPTEVKLPESETPISVSVLDPTQSLSEYVDLKLPTAGLAGMLLNNKVTASFLEVVPGLPDMVSLGKLWHAVTHPSKKFAPDLIILDAPASGHAVSLLKAPLNFQRITKAGPIYRDASEMASFFSNEKFTQVILTSIPEEMSLQETKEFQRLISKDFPAPKVIVMKCFPELPDLTKEEKDSLVWKAYDYSFHRWKREQEAIEVLPKSARNIVPFFFPDPKAPPLFQRVSEALT